MLGTEYRFVGFEVFPGVTMVGLAHFGQAPQGA